jgi:hypothetical protein
MPRKETDLEQRVRKDESSGAQSGHSRTTFPPSTSNFARTARSRVKGGFIHNNPELSHPWDRASSSADQKAGQRAFLAEAKASRSGGGHPKADKARRKRAWRNW